MAKISISSDVQSIMDERGILQDDVRQVVDGCDDRPHFRSEDGQRFLAKKRIGNFTVNVEFASFEGNIEICNVYSHVVGLSGGQA